jgi:hypothetical protein
VGIRASKNVHRAGISVALSSKPEFVYGGTVVFSKRKILHACLTLTLMYCKTLHMSLSIFGIAVIVFHYAKFSNNDTANMPVQAVRLRLVFRLLRRAFLALSHKEKPVQVFIEKEIKKKEKNNHMLRR